MTFPAFIPWLLFALTGCFCATVIWYHGKACDERDLARGEAASHLQTIAMMQTRLSAAGYASSRSDSKSRILNGKVLRLRTALVRATAERNYLMDGHSGWDRLTVGEQAAWLDKAEEIIEREHGSVTA